VGTTLALASVAITHNAVVDRISLWLASSMPPVTGTTHLATSARIGAATPFTGYLGNSGPVGCVASLCEATCWSRPWIG
jgi:hypothetical protein